jgi:homocysteine S-methyltransferase
MNKSKIFLDELNNSILIGDGAIGTELLARGEIPNIGIESLNIKNPDVVIKLHQDYISAGSRVIETNTFEANIPNLIKYNADKNFREIILAGVRLAQKAALNKNVYIAGSIGPLPTIDGEVIPISDQKKHFKDIILTLLDGGIDLLIFETFINVNELINAISIARSITDIPIIAQMAFESHGKTVNGDSTDDFAKKAIEAGVDVLGANCGDGVSSIIKAIKQIAHFQKSMSAFMNAGFAEQVENRSFYLATPHYLANRACELVDQGVNLIGGCCGTNPTTINTISKVIKSYKFKRTIIVAPQPKIIKEEKIVKEKKITPIIPSGIIVELDPPKSLNLETITNSASQIKDAGIDFITLADNPMASVRVDLLTVANTIKQKTGLSIITHLTGRDRNRISLQSTIMGAHILGIESILCITGDPIRLYNETNTSGVFDVNSIGLIKLIKDFNEGRRTINNYKTFFSIGAALNPNVKNIESQIDKLKRKIEAGADYILTQPIFDINKFEILNNSLEKNNINIPIFIGIFPLVSARNADFLHNEVPGMIIPEVIRDRLYKYEKKEDQKLEGQNISIELAEKLLPYQKHYYLISPGNKVESIINIINNIKSKINLTK